MIHISCALLYVASSSSSPITPMSVSQTPSFGFSQKYNKVWDGVFKPGATTITSAAIVHRCHATDSRTSFLRHK
jgi:hypothetical protein